MAEKYGVEQVTRVMDVLVEAGNVAARMIGDQGGAAAKVGHLLRMSDELIGLVGLDAAKLKAELADLSPEERAQLMAHVKEKFDLADDALEAKIEAGLGLAVKLQELVVELVALVRPADVAPAPAS